MPGLGGAFVPDRGLGVVGRQFAALGIEVADQRSRLAVAGIGGAAQPALARGRVARDAAPFHQRETPARLARAHALLGRLPVELRGGFEVALDADRELGHHAEQVERGRQAGGGGLRHLHRRLRAGLLRRGLGCGTQQGERVAELALRATGLGRAAIPFGGLRQVALRFGTGGEDIAEQRLAVGRAALGGATRPLLRSHVVGLVGGVAGEQVGAAGPMIGGGDAHEVQRRQRRLRLDPPGAGGPIEPLRGIGTANRHAYAFQIAAPDTIFSLGVAATCRLREQMEAGRALPALQQTQASATLCRRRDDGGEPVENRRHQSGSRIPW